MESLGAILTKTSKNSITENCESKSIHDYPVFMTLDEIREYGFTITVEPPKPVQCLFCGKSLNYSGRRSFISKTIVGWESEHDRCDCELSQIHYKELEAKKEKEAQEQKERDRRIEFQKKVDGLFNSSKLGDRFKTRTFDNFVVGEHNQKAVNMAYKYTEEFEKFKIKGIGLYISGNYGTGKTHIAAAIAIELMNKCIPVIFTTLPRLLGQIKGTFDNDVEKLNEQQIIDIFSNVDLLILDDVGKERVTEWRLEKLFEILNNRYENNLPIVFTSNYSLEVLPQKLSISKNNTDVAESIVSRIYEMCRGIPMNGLDYRKRT
ncbi:MAG: ATP-binding protein [Clostridiales bacterium]|nr:ATP-binding protein [Clostridiales bacterium]